MAFRDFSFPGVLQVLALALAINTEKARSEFIIAPVSMELRRMSGDAFGLFSGIEFDVDASRGLNGFFDFIPTRSPLQSVLTAPLVAIVEAKDDNLRTGLGPCIAAMVAAREFNAHASSPMDKVYGVVTTGGAWKFLRLTGSALELDRREYFRGRAGPDHGHPRLDLAGRLIDRQIGRVGISTVTDSRGSL